MNYLQRHQTAERREYVLRGYLDAILFTEEPCGREFGTDLMTAINSDVEKFIAAVPVFDFSFIECERIGHDFWLTRNGHGAGFWDGDWNDADFVKRALTFVAYQGPFEISFDDSFYMDIG
jgi:hypothetical protein|tara:strand:+ start:365 stop:724 length:360 start_codon:yes stop_codon:yes gene_type:complete